MSQTVNSADAALDEKTAAIVEAARSTFLVRGFDAVSMDQIAMVAGVSKRTVYNRFRSKEELFGAAIMRTCESLMPFSAEDVETDLPPDEFIRELSIQFVTELLKPEFISLRRIAAFEAERTPSIGAAYLANGPQWIVDHALPIVNRLIEKGSLVIDDPREAIWQLGALITEPLHTQMLMGVQPDNLEDAINRQVSHGVAAFLKIYGR